MASALLIQKDQKKSREKRGVDHHHHHHYRKGYKPSANKVYKTAEKVAAPVKDVQMQAGEVEG